MARLFLRLLMLGIASAAQPASADPPTGPDPHSAATLSIRADSCEARWNGEPVTPDQILARSVALLEAAIERIGGPQNATEDNIPYLGVEAIPETSWRCMAPTLFALQRSGMIKIELRDALVFFAYNAQGVAEPTAASVDIGANGRIAWNGEPVDMNGLRAHVRALGDEASAPDNLFFDVAPEATFLDLYAAARAVDDEGGRATLTGCGGPIGPYRPGAPQCPPQPN